MAGSGTISLVPFQRGRTYIRAGFHLPRPGSMRAARLLCGLLFASFLSDKTRDPSIRVYIPEMEAAFFFFGPMDVRLGAAEGEPKRRENRGEREQETRAHFFCSVDIRGEGNFVFLISVLARG